MSGLKLRIDDKMSHVPDVSDVHILISDDYWHIDYLNFNIKTPIKALIKVICHVIMYSLHSTVYQLGGTYKGDL